MAELIIYRGASELATVHIGDNTTYNGQLMGENEVQATFESPVNVMFAIGDYITLNSKPYRLNEIPELVKSARNRFTYTATFEGREYTLHNKLLRHLGAIDFTYFATPLTGLQLIIDNINEIDPGWIIGEVDDLVDGKLLSFSGDSCRSGLTKLADEFKMEFLFSGQTIHFKKTVGSTIPDLTLQYGKGNGLYTLTRQPVTDAKVYTRVFGVGGSQNLPENYRSGLRNLSFPVGYIERNVGIYGVIETSVPFPDIFPRRTAAITATPANNEIIDTTLDFDLNTVFVKGQAKIVFKTGDLGGNEFEILHYNHTNKRIRFDYNKEDSGYTLPNDTVKPKVGDKYTLVGIEMPQTHIDAAELELKEATTEFAELHKDPLSAFGLSIDEKFIRDNSLIGAIGVGDRIRTIDSDMGVDKALRVQAISYPIANPAKITATINDQVTYTLTEKVIKDISTQKNEIVKVQDKAATLRGMAYKDMVSLAKLDETIQEGGYLKNTMIDTLWLKAEVINAAYIQALEIIAKQIQTAASGRRISMKDDNTLKFYGAAGNLAIEMIEENGVAKLKFYDSSGNKVWEAGQSGIVYVNNIPESYTPTQLRLVSSNQTETADSLVAALDAGQTCYINFAEAENGRAISADRSLIAYLYNAGQNVNADANRQYEGYKNIDGNKTENVTNGWYVKANEVFTSSNLAAGIYTLDFIYISGGVITDTKHKEGVHLTPANSTCIYPTPDPA